MQTQNILEVPLNNFLVPSTGDLDLVHLSDHLKQSNFYKEETSVTEVIEGLNKSKAFLISLLKSTYIAVKFYNLQKGDKETPGFDIVSVPKQPHCQQNQRGTLNHWDGLSDSTLIDLLGHYALTQVKVFPSTLDRAHIPQGIDLIQVIQNRLHRNSQSPAGQPMHGNFQYERVGYAPAVHRYPGDPRFSDYENVMQNQYFGTGRYAQTAAPWDTLEWPRGAARFVLEERSHANIEQTVARLMTPLPITLQIRTTKQIVFAIENAKDVLQTAKELVLVFTSTPLLPASVAAKLNLDHYTGWYIAVDADEVKWPDLDSKVVVVSNNHVM